MDGSEGGEGVFNRQESIKQQLVHTYPWTPFGSNGQMVATYYLQPPSIKGTISHMVALVRSILTASSIGLASPFCQGGHTPPSYAVSEPSPAIYHCHKA